jgi:DNA polymerase
MTIYDVEVEQRLSTLEELEEEWRGCTKCRLGERREAEGTNMAFGEGELGGIMFIAGGPGDTEERRGRPFVGPTGQSVLRPVIEGLGIKDNSYITNLVVCRSCVHLHDSKGQPMFNRGGGIKWKDEDPTTDCIVSCLPRLYREIYIVDPILIVALGAVAATTLRKSTVAITRERGKQEHVTIPSVVRVPSFTAKKGAWIRGLDENGKFIMPTMRGEVRYSMISTLHPAHVYQRIKDKSKDGPVDQFMKDMSFTVKVYDRYILETAGIKIEREEKELVLEDDDD